MPGFPENSPIPYPQVDARVSPFFLPPWPTDPTRPADCSARTFDECRLRGRWNISEDEDDDDDARTLWFVIAHTTSSFKRFEPSNEHRAYEKKTDELVWFSSHRPAPSRSTGIGIEHFLTFVETVISIPDENVRLPVQSSCLCIYVSMLEHTPWLQNYTMTPSSVIDQKPEQIWNVVMSSTNFIHLRF